VAAGNEDLNACNFQPASSEFAMTVGSVDKDDSRSSFSNWGECVSDIAIYSIILLLTIAEATLLTFPTFFSHYRSISLLQVHTFRPHGT
jgi:Subtilase family